MGECPAHRSAVIGSTASADAWEGRVGVVIDDIMVGDPGGFLGALAPDAVVRVDFLPAYEASARYGRRDANGAS